MSSLQEYVEKLACADEAERTFAAEDIGYLNAPEGVPALLRRLGEEESRAVRDAIFQALIRIDANAAIEGSIRLLASDDPRIRNHAVNVLRRKAVRAIPFLNAVMRDGDKDLRKLVLDILRGVPAGGVEAIYEAALGDKDPNVVITAVENLGLLRAREFRGRIEELLQAGSHPMQVAACVEALVGMGDPSSFGMIRRRFPNLAVLPDFLLAAFLKAMAVWGTAEDFNEVAALLPLRGPHLRSAILGALFAIRARCPSAAANTGALLAALRRIVEDGDPPLCRYQAVRILAFLAAEDDVYAFLVACLSSPERLVRLAAAESLRAAGRPGLEPLLAARANEETDEEVLQALSC